MIPRISETDFAFICPAVVKKRSMDAGSKNRETYSKLLNEADDQLIIAKNNGRNCIGFKGRPFIHDNRRPAGGSVK